ncbi:MAG: hypothetical protein LBD10_05020 [Desulfobulbus sp.]|jgi:hypothetical protein|uniref:hypothetical protein n=1 Tax=Desulfobulbus sp. TaxID=895 RepID=UPI002843FFF2|nr:hypothetical protein [Desulfobulbus sp.]MDR2549546.1 hypothetical protein [Desulfobulbus sp.]
MKTVGGHGLQCAARIFQLVERQGIVLLDPQRNRQLHLAYPEAAVWDLLIRRWPATTMRSMLAVIAGIGEDEADRLIAVCLDRWRTEGWLEPGAAP